MTAMMSETTPAERARLHKIFNPHIIDDGNDIEGKHLDSFRIRYQPLLEALALFVQAERLAATAAEREAMKARLEADCHHSERRKACWHDVAQRLVDPALAAVSPTRT